MKNIKITLHLKVTDEYYEEESLELKNDIESGCMQREFKEGSDGGVKEIKATFEILKDDGKF